LRLPFRGVSKYYLQQYLSILPWTCELSVATATLLPAMFGRFTGFAA
jgi:hypothetical protein